jgi:hypothetical protein
MAPELVLRPGGSKIPVGRVVSRSSSKDNGVTSKKGGGSGRVSAVDRYSQRKILVVHSSRPSWSIFSSKPHSFGNPTPLAVSSSSKRCDPTSVWIKALGLAGIGSAQAIGSPVRLATYVCGLNSPGGVSKLLIGRENLGALSSKLQAHREA